MIHELYIAGVVLYWIVMTVTVVHVIMDNRQPAKTMAWALVILFVSFVGQMLGFVGQQDLRLPDKHKQLIDLYVNQNFSLPFKDNDIGIFTEGYSFFASLFEAIGAAREHIHIDLYIFEDDALGMLVSDMLIDKARQGVEVRIIYDDVGCWNVKHRFFERMREEGIEVSPFLPVRFPSFTSKVNYRNHRKLIVIDGRVGFIGGMNIALRYVKGQKPTDTWRDTMVRVVGKGVYALQRAFLIDWYFVDRTLLSDRKYYPDSPSPRPSPREGSPTPLIQIVTSGPASPYPPPRSLSSWRHLTSCLTNLCSSP